MIDKKVYYIGSAGIAFLGLALAVQGCDLQKAVKFDVPSGVQSAIDTEATQPLSDSQYVWDNWENWVTSNSQALSRNIEDANQRVALIENLTSMGIGALGEVSGAFPGGAVLFSGVSLLAGWFLKRPSEDKVVAKEKEDSYNAGIAKGEEITKTIKEAIS